MVGALLGAVGGFVWAIAEGEVLALPQTQRLLMQSRLALLRIQCAEVISHVQNDTRVDEPVVNGHSDVRKAE